MLHKTMVYKAVKSSRFRERKTSISFISAKSKSSRFRAIKVLNTNSKIYFLRKSEHTKHAETGVWMIDSLLGSALVVISGVVALSLINAANNSTIKINLLSKSQLAITGRMEIIREEAFKLHCLQGYGCDDNSISGNIKYDESKLEDDCANQSFGQSLLTKLEGKNLSADFNLQAFDPNSPSVLIESDLTPIGNALLVNLNAPSSNAKASSKIVPNALGWCK